MAHGRESETSATLDAITSGVLIVDRESGEIRTVNIAAAGMIGLGRGELVGSQIAKFFPDPEGGEVSKNGLRETTLHRADGTKVTVETARADLDRNGRNLFVLNFVDAAAWRKTEQELRERNENLERILNEHRRNTESMKKWLHCEIEEHRQTVFKLNEKNKFLKSIIDSSASISIVSTDKSGNILFWSKGAERLFGYTSEEALKTLNINELYPNDEATRNRIVEIRKSIYDNKQETTTEIQEVTKDGRRIWIRLTASPSFDELGNVTGTLGIGEDITERKRTEEELKKSFQKMKKTLEGAIQAMAALVETRDPYTAGHERRVAQLAPAIAQEMGLGDERVNHIRVASAMHDVGKIYVPAEILSKPGILTDMEFNLIKTHPQVGFDILKTIEFPWPVAEIVMQHHERMDGSGYPRHLKGESITLEARVISVADVVEAMGSHRPYRPALGIKKALEEIEAKAGTLYDANVAAACLRVFDKGRFTFQ